ncbi:MAG: tRNA (adenosine(37)-N6)-dimethylallyltransferase MiaA, partial [Desulfatiglandaceae bacterium]
DSMQVYRGMDVGTAKPTLEEQKGIPHHLLDVVDPDEDFSAATFRSMALALVREICSRGKICLVVGGTGLYIKALLGGLFRSPPADPRLRETLRLECDNHGSTRLYERLKLLDPESASRVHPNDKVRIIRSLEIIHLTNRRPSELSREHGFRDRALGALKLCLKINREELYHRINRRSAAMLRAGLVGETESLLSKGYSSQLKPMKSIGYRHIVKYLEGTWSLAEATRNLQRDTRRYAKRQLTWFRADPEFTWISPDDFDLASKKIRAFLVGAA